MFIQVWQHCLFVYLCGLHPDAQSTKYVRMLCNSFFQMYDPYFETQLISCIWLYTVPVATFSMAVICGTDKLRCDILLNMLLVSVGVVISSYGEIHFNILGTFYQVTGIFAEALRLVLTQVLLQKKGLTLNPITSLYYIAPCRYSNFNILNLF